VSIVIAGAVVLKSTLAAKDDVYVVLRPLHDHPVIEKDSYVDRIVNGGYSASSDDPSIASAEFINDILRVTGLEAGTVTVTAVSNVGLSLSYPYQISDKSRIGSYTVKRGAEVHFQDTGEIRESPVMTDPASAHESISWLSMDPKVASVDERGNITSVSRGTTIVTGRFLDRWGEERELRLPVYVSSTKEPDRSEEGNSQRDEDAKKDRNTTAEFSAGPQYLESLMDDERFSSLMEEGVKHLGKPYLYGGIGPNEFDCSGYVSYVLAHSIMPGFKRTSAQGLYKTCTPILEEDVQPGDLVFFTKTYDVARTVTHVGFYVGDRQMLHAGDPVGYVSIDTPYWTKHFYGFGRLP